MVVLRAHSSGFLRLVQYVAVIVSCITIACIKIACTCQVYGFGRFSISNLLPARLTILLQRVNEFWILPICKIKPPRHMISFH
jgi:hypothetical protein